MKSRTLVFLLPFIVILLGATAMAQSSGTLAADPNPCTIDPAQSSCSITVTWWITGAATGRVTVEDVGGSETVFASGTSGTATLTALAPPHQYTLRLYDTSGTEPVWLDETVVLAMGTGDITADPNPCTLGSGATSCTTTMAWTSTNVSHVLVTVEDVSGGGESTFSTAASGNKSAILLGPPHDYVFRLYDASSTYAPLLITETSVRATGSGGIDVSPNPCPIPTGATDCKATVTWNAQNVSGVRVTMQDSQGGGEVDFPGNSTVPGSYVASILPLPHSYTFRLYDGYGNWLDSNEVVATGRGILSAAPDPCQIPSGTTTCNLTLNWSTDNVVSAMVTQQDAYVGTAETTVATGTSGDKVVQVSGPPHRYFFRLYDNSSGTPYWLDGYEVTVSGSGAISISPDPCQIPDGSTTCVTYVTWTTANVTNAEVTVQDTAGGGETTFSTALAGTQSYALQGPPHDYFFTLYDVSSGTPMYLDSWEVTAIAPPVTPAAPSNLQAATASMRIGKKTKTVVNLTWQDNSTNETAFYVERCQGSTCTNFVRITAVGASVTKYTDTGISRRRTYRYRVKAHSSTDGDSGYSNIATVTVP